MIFGKDKSCRAGFRDHSRTLNAFWFFAQRECPIHFREVPVSTTLPQRFCKNCQTSVPGQSAQSVQRRAGGPDEPGTDEALQSDLSSTVILFSALAWMVSPATALFVIAWCL